MSGDKAPSTSAEICRRLVNNILRVLPEVYMPKFVQITNRKLHLTEWVVFSSTTVFVVAILCIFPLAQKRVYPFQKIDLELVPGTHVWGNGGDACSGLLREDVIPEYTLGGTGFNPSNLMCLPSCAFHGGGVNPGLNCLNGEDLQVHFRNTLFVPTMLTEDVSLRVCQTGSATPALCTAESCPFTWNDAQETCVRRQQYAIPGIEKTSVRIHFDYEVDLPGSIFHSIFSSIDRLPVAEAQAILVDNEGKKIKDFGILRADNSFSMTVEDILKAGGMSIDGTIGQGERDSIFPDGDNSNRQRRIRPTTRVVGADVTITFDLKNSHRVEDASSPQAVIMSVTAEPEWASKSTTSFIDFYGSTQTKSFVGIKIRTGAFGYMSWFQINQLIFTCTLGISWIILPCFLIFFLAMYCLGELSNIYRGFVFGDVQLHRAFTGVSARIMEIGWTHADMADNYSNRGTLQDLSLDRICKRMDLVLQSCEDLDEGERLNFSKFVFEEAGRHEHRNVTLEDMMLVMTSNENLGHKDIVSIIDKDDNQDKSNLEWFFWDPTLKAFAKDRITLQDEEMSKEAAKARQSASIAGNAEDRLEDMLVHGRILQALKLFSNTTYMAERAQNIVQMVRDNAGKKSVRGKSMRGKSMRAKTQMGKGKSTYSGH